MRNLVPVILAPRNTHSLDARAKLPICATSTAGRERRNFTRLLQREIAASLGEGFRFRATACLILSLMIVSALINAVRYRAEVSTYQATLAEYEAQLAVSKVRDLATLGHPAVKPPWKLAFLVDGGQSSGPNVYRQPLQPWQESRLESRHSSNQRLGPSEPLDWLFLIKVVFSLAAFVLSYDAFCGEQQRAVLRMLLSYPVARWQIVASKAVAVWLGLAIPFLLGAPVCLLILYTLGEISFTLSEWLKIIAVAGLGLWASAIFGLIGLLVSALSRESARSLAILALIWITAVVVVPAGGALLVNTLQPLPAGFETGEKLEGIREEVEQEYGPGNWRSPELARLDNYLHERESAKIQHRRQAQQEELRRGLFDRRFEQQQMARRLSAISPMSLIQDLTELIAGSGPYRDRAFSVQAWAYLQPLEEAVKALDYADPESPHVFFIHQFMSDKQVVAERIPRFEFREGAVAQGIRASARHILVLALTTLALAAAVLVAFGREDVG